MEGPALGAPLLLLHGLARCWQDFETLIPSLLPHSHLFAFDHRGHGSSGRTEEAYLVTDYVRDICGLLEREFSEPVFLFGHSLGAMVALAVAAQQPEAVRGIVLEDPPFHTMGRRIGQTPWQAQFIGIQAVARQGGGIEQLTDGLASIEIPAASDPNKTVRLGELRDHESLLFSASCLTGIDPEVFTPVIEGRWLDGYEERELYPRVKCPVLILQGDPFGGGALTEEDALLALSLLPEGRRLRFRGCGHLIHQDRPAAVLGALQDFIAGFDSNDKTPSTSSSADWIQVTRSDSNQSANP
jgi:pimeloyl-ACP methyl ester carboxylesterase